MATAYRDAWKKLCAWVLREAHRTRARALRAELNRAFTEHPEDAGETYLQHLRFTSMMSVRFLYTTLVIFVHGIFPFLLTRAASDQIEVIYRIMKTRIPKSRREAIDADMDYSV